MEQGVASNSFHNAFSRKYRTDYLIWHHHIHIRSKGTHFGGNGSWHYHRIIVPSHLVSCPILFIAISIFNSKVYLDPKRNSLFVENFNFSKKYFSQNGK